MKKNNPKNKQQAVQGADLRFRHFELARRLTTNMLEEMEKENLKPSDVLVVLNDLCKFVILALAEVNKEDALDVVVHFVDLCSDVTCLMMRIASDNFEKA